MTLGEMYAIIAEIDPNEEPWSDGWKAEVLLLASAQIGYDPEKLHAFTGIPKAFIAECGERLEANGIWRDGRVYAEWADPEGGGVALVCDACVALGFLSRVRSEEES